jgi:ketosteroid isomerase-like protein
MRRIIATVIVATLAACGSLPKNTPLPDEEERQAILAILDEYVAAVNAADADRLERLFWIDDPRFAEIEDHIPMPFCATVFRDIGDWIRKSAKPGLKQRFREPHVYLLAADVAYSIALQDLLESKTTSRVTLVYLKKAGEWRIIHGHFSNVPK